MTRTAQLLSRRPRVVHEHDWRGGLLWVLVSVLALGLLDKWDNEDFWRREAMRANRELAAREARESLPNPAIVLDASNAERYGIRLSEIAGGLDKQRAELNRRKP